MREEGASKAGGRLAEAEEHPGSRMARNGREGGEGKEPREAGGRRARGGVWTGQGEGEGAVSSLRISIN